MDWKKSVELSDEASRSYSLASATDEPELSGVKLFSSQTNELNEQPKTN
jgi:hypothetical protein